MATQTASEEIEDQLRGGMSKASDVSSPGESPFDTCTCSVIVTVRNDIF